jgi:hypothetical protein
MIDSFWGKEENQDETDKFLKNYILKKVYKNKKEMDSKR